MKYDCDPDSDRPYSMCVDTRADASQLKNLREGTREVRAYDSDWLNWGLHRERITNFFGRSQKELNCLNSVQRADCEYREEPCQKYILPNRQSGFATALPFISWWPCMFHFLWNKANHERTCVSARANSKTQTWNHLQIRWSVLIPTTSSTSAAFWPGCSGPILYV